MQLVFLISQTSNVDKNHFLHTSLGSELSRMMQLVFLMSQILNIYKNFYCRHILRML